MDLEKKVFEIIAQCLEISASDLSEETAIGDFPSWDSLGHMVIISELEKEFSIKFDMESIIDMEDIADIIEIVEEHIT